MGLIDRMLAGDRRALARLISVVEHGGADARRVMAQVYPHAGRAWTVGMTGPPGAGKSTLVSALAAEWRRRDRRVAIVAVDPTSPFTGGALLGDRIRMQPHGGDAGVFVRSMATRGHAGGLAQATSDVVRVLDAAGFDIIIVETVGAGQAEVDIVHASAYDRSSSRCRVWATTSRRPKPEFSRSPMSSWSIRLIAPMPKRCGTTSVRCCILLGTSVCLGGADPADRRDTW